MTSPFATTRRLAPDCATTSRAGLDSGAEVRPALPLVTVARCSALDTAFEQCTDESVLSKEDQALVRIPCLRQRIATTFVHGWVLVLRAPQLHFTRASSNVPARATTKSLIVTSRAANSIVSMVSGESWVWMAFRVCQTMPGPPEATAAPPPQRHVEYREAEQERDEAPEEEQHHHPQ